MRGGGSLVSPTADAAPDARPRCWIVLADAARREALTAALVNAGWDVAGVFAHPVRACERLRKESLPPDLVLCGLRFDDGDALALIRHLGRLRARTGLFVLSGQQRAVISSAVSLAEFSGLRVAGSAEEPVDADAVVRALRGFRLDGAASRAVAPLTPPEPPTLLRRSTLRRLLDAGGLQAWMQPKLRLDSGEIVGFEALMRGIDDDGSLIPPDSLVPALAAYSLLEEATLLMLDRAAAFVAQAMSDGLAVSAAVNVSLASLSDPAFCRELPRVLGANGLDPSWITLEVTETDAMGEIGKVMENTTRIRMLGFNLSIDDFGTAYSSLAQLMAIPFSELKIDRDFVRDLDRNERRQTIVRACAGLGRQFGLHVVAEGVETDDELQTVLACGCTHAQGWRVARAMPPDRVLPWLKALPDQVWAAEHAPSAAASSGR